MRIFKNTFGGLQVNIIFSVVIITLSLIGLEAYYRYVYDETDGLSFMLTNRRWFNRHISLNESGFRDKIHTPERPAGVTRIGVIGDSLTFGHGIKNPQDRFSDLLEQMLNSHCDQDYQVYNMSKIGWTTSEELAFLKEKALQYDFDALILGYSPGDIEGEIIEAQGPFDFSQQRPPQALRGIIERSYFANFLWYRTKATRFLKQYQDWLIAGYEDQKTWQRHCTRLTQIADICKKNNIRLYFVLFPDMTTLGTAYPYREYHRRAEKLFTTYEQVVFVDLFDIYKDFPQRGLTVNKFDPHPNEKAHRLAAECIFKHMMTDTTQLSGL